MTMHHSLIFIPNPALSMTQSSLKLTRNPCISLVALQMKVLGSAKESPLQAVLEIFFW